MRPKRPCHCTYVVAVDPGASSAELQILAAHLSTLRLAGCEVIVLDPAPEEEEAVSRQRILRWVGRHVALQGDVLQAAVDLASTEKIIIGSPDTRYTAAELSSICKLLDRCEVVEPAEFVEPMPWWGAVDAGRMLLQRGLEQAAGSGQTFAFRKSAWKPLPGMDESERGSLIERLTIFGAELQNARDVFVRREPSRFTTWLRSRICENARSNVVPFEAAVFACIIPMLVLLAVIGGATLAGGYAGVIAFASILIAVRGRSGARRFYPLRACFFAPLAIIERSMAVYAKLVIPTLSAAKRRNQGGGHEKPASVGTSHTRRSG